MCLSVAGGHVPVIDLAPARTGDPAERARVAADIGRACTDLGFLVISGHGVEGAVIDAVLDASRRFFEQPLDVKRQSMPPSPYIFRGYFPSQASALAGSLDVETPGDLCEVYAMNRFDDAETARRAGVREGIEGWFAPNIWPEGIEGFADAWLAYYRANERLADELLRLMALALGLDERWFEATCSEHISNMVVNYYPPQPRPPLPGQLRRGAHTDYGSITILYQDDNPGGLQVQLADGTWADVPHIPGTYVVNIGDLLAAWTNDRWVSTMHRVVNPEREVADRARLSIPFFHAPNYDALIECIPTCTGPDDPPHHPPVTSGAWHLAKMQKSVY